MTNRHGMPVLDRPVQVPRPHTKAVDERESPVALVLNRCARGCKRTGHFQLGGEWFCECCISAEIVRSAR